MKMISNHPLLLQHHDKKWLNRWPDHICLIDMHSNSLDSKNSPGLPENCIGLLEHSTASSVIETALTTGLRHIVQLSNPNFKNEIEISAELIQSPQLFFENPILSIFSNSQRSKTSYNIERSSEKKVILSSISTYLKDISRSETVFDSAIAIADELYTNAIFNAPTHPDGTNRHSHLSRNTEVHLDQTEVAELFLCENGQHLLLCCSDPFGSLNPESVLRRMLYCYTHGISSSLNMDSGGAGIGFQMMFNLSMSMYIGVSRNERTIVCCVLPLGKSHKQHDSISKNLHLVILEKGTI